MKAALTIGTLLVMSSVASIDITAVEAPPIQQLTLQPEIIVEEIPESVQPVEVIEPTYIQTSDTYHVESEGVSSYYYNTTVYGVREGETDVITSTASVPGLGDDICVGNPLGDDSYQNYACVVLPESLADEYGRGDKVLVEYNGNIIPCVVIDFNQIEHGDSLNFVGEFNYSYGDTAWIVEEE